MLTTEDVIRFAREAVEEMGADHISPAYRTGDDEIPTDEIDPLRHPHSLCRYVTPDGKPGCIVGHVLHKAGVTLDALSEQEGNGAYSVASGVEIEVTGVETLSKFQRLQDGGVPWGFILDRHEENSAEIRDEWPSTQREEF